MKKLNSISKTGKNTVITFILKYALLIIVSIFLTGIAYGKTEYDWTGIYGGLNIGGIFNDVHLKSNNLGFMNADGTCNINSNFASFNSGLQLGYAYQFHSRVVLGFEADYSYNFNKRINTDCTSDISPIVSDRFTIKNQQQGSVNGRVGYGLSNHLLPYFMLGGSLAGMGLKYNNEGGDYYSKNTAALGWKLGAGLEWQFVHSWSVRAEYFFVSYNNAVNMKIPVVYDLYDPNGEARVNLNANNIRAAINYWF